jgi:hypothetical protein
VRTTYANGAGATFLAKNAKSWQLLSIEWNYIKGAN